MKNSPLSWLECSEKTLAQAVDDWDAHRNPRVLEAWLAMSNRDVGDIDYIAPEKMHTFVQGVLELDYKAAAAYHLPMEWPLESIEKTQILRDIMVLVPAWREQAREDLNSPNELSIGQLLYPLEEHKRILASNRYTPGTEATRMHLGMPPNNAWWRRLPLWTEEERDTYAQSNTWEHLLKKVLANPHPEQGTRLGLIFPFLEAQQKNQAMTNGVTPVFSSPTVEQVLDSAVQGKMALALWQALNCPRNAIPDPSWWSHWDKWCRDEQPRAELALATMLLARAVRFELGNQEHMLRMTLVRLASLREPPENFSILNMNAERKKYASWSLDDLAERTFPVESRTLRFFEGLADSKEQLLLHYQALQEKTQPTLGLPESVLRDFLVS